MSFSDEQPFPPGTVIAGRYRLANCLGMGGAGAVYGATHLGLNGRVALKVLRGAAAKDPVSIERFKREAQIAHNLKSAHIVAVTDLGLTDGGEPFMVMELLDGHDLDRIALDETLIRIDYAVDLVAQASVGVAQAHAAGLVHRDLKPGNLFLAKQPEGPPVVKVLDFGLTLVSSGESGRLTQSAAQMGTPLYMSPEQVLDPRNVDARTDQHALGLILYELLAKRTAYDGPTPMSIATAITVSPVPSVRALRPEVPEALDHAIQRAIAKRPEHRFPDVGAFVAAIAPYGGPDARRAAEIIGIKLATPKTHLAPQPSLLRAQVLAHVEGQAAPNPYGPTAYAGPGIPQTLLGQGSPPASFKLEVDPLEATSASMGPIPASSARGLSIGGGVASDPAVATAPSAKRSSVAVWLLGSSMVLAAAAAVVFFVVSRVGAAHGAATHDAPATATAAEADKPPAPIATSNVSVAPSTAAPVATAAETSAALAPSSSAAPSSTSPSAHVVLQGSLPKPPPVVTSTPVVIPPATGQPVGPTHFGATFGQHP